MGVGERSECRKVDRSLYIDLVRTEAEAKSWTMHSLHGEPVESAASEHEGKGRSSLWAA